MLYEGVYYAFSNVRNRAVCPVPLVLFLPSALTSITQRAASLNVSAYMYMYSTVTIKDPGVNFELPAGSSLVGPSIERGFVFVCSCGRLFVL